MRTDLTQTVTRHSILLGVSERKDLSFSLLSPPSLLFCLSLSSTTATVNFPHVKKDQHPERVLCAVLKVFYLT